MNYKQNGWLQLQQGWCHLGHEGPGEDLTMRLLRVHCSLLALTQSKANKSSKIMSFEKIKIF